MSFAANISNYTPIYFYGVRSEGETMENIAAKFDQNGPLTIAPNVPAELKPGDVVVIDFKASTISVS